MRIREEEGSEELVLNLTPMIDVVFLLLIFFMLSTTFLNPEKEIGIELPEAQWASIQAMEADELIINVFKDGRVTVNGNELGHEALVETLKYQARKNPETPVTIRGDGMVAHKEIVRVMDACGAAGLRDFAIGTLSPRGS